MIYCIGDSFTYGDELPDRNLAWPMLLGNLLNESTVNLGKCATGNTRIIKRTLDLVINKTPDLKIICVWSSPERHEFADEHGIYDVWPARSVQVWNNTSSYRKILTDYVTDHHHVEWAYSNWLRQIILTQTFLKTNNIPYYMFNAFTPMAMYHELDSTLKERYTRHREFIDFSRYLAKPYDSFVQWTYHCPRGPGGHPLEEGHRVIAENIYKTINERGWDL